MTPAASAALAALRSTGVRLTPAQAGAMASAVDGGGSVAYMQTAGADGGCNCDGGGTPFAGYAPAGLLQVGPLAVAGAQVVDGTINISGADLPPGSVLVLDRVVGTNNQAITAISSDSIPQAIGQNGVGFAIANLNNQNAPGIFLALNTTRELTVQVRFGAGAAVGDFVAFQVLSKGGRSVQAQACAIR